MALFRLYLVVVLLAMILFAWLEITDERVLRKYLRRLNPMRDSNSYWGALESSEREDREGGFESEEENPRSPD
jgi:hypothetical protein